MVAAAKPARARWPKPKPTSHISRFSKKNDQAPCVKASKFILNAFRVCAEVTLFGSRFQRGTTLSVRKWCLVPAGALQFWLFSLALKLSLSRLFLPLRAEAGPFVARWGALFGMQWLSICSYPFISLYACTKSPLPLLTSSVVSPTALNLSLYPSSFCSSCDILNALFELSPARRCICEIEVSRHSLRSPSGVAQD